MDKKETFAKGLIYLAHLISISDGVRDDAEIKVIKRIREIENISTEDFMSFQQEIIRLNDQEIFEEGISALKGCKPETRMRVFVWLYKVLQADGIAAVEEAKFILNALNAMKMDLNDVIKASEDMGHSF